MNLKKLLDCLNTMNDSHRGELPDRDHTLAYLEAYRMAIAELSHPVEWILELTDVVEEPGPLCPSDCDGMAMAACGNCRAISNVIPRKTPEELDRLIEFVKKNVV